MRVPCRKRHLEKNTHDRAESRPNQGPVAKLFVEGGGGGGGGGNGQRGKLIGGRRLRERPSVYTACPTRIGKRVFLGSVTGLEK